MFGRKVFLEVITYKLARRPLIPLVFPIKIMADKKGRDLGFFYDIKKGSGGREIFTDRKNVADNKYKKCPNCGKDIPKEDKTKATKYLVVRRLEK